MTVPHPLFPASQYRARSATRLLLRAYVCYVLFALKSIYRLAHIHALCVQMVSSWRFVLHFRKNDSKASFATNLKPFLASNLFILNIIACIYSMVLITSFEYALCSYFQSISNRSIKAIKAGLLILVILYYRNE